MGSGKAKFVCTGHWGSNSYAPNLRPNSKLDTFREPKHEKITNFDAFDYIEQPKMKSGLPAFKMPKLDNKHL